MADIISDVIDFLFKITDAGEAIIKFKKKDGSLRVMRCTLDFDKIPASKHPKGVDLKKILKRIQTSNILNVFDLDKHDWRSVPFSTVTWLHTPLKVYQIVPK
jgi:hypothetical protein